MKKETIIKAIKEMNINLLDVVLDNNIAYMDVSKDLFLEKLKNKFDNLKNKGINEFVSVSKGTCEKCYKGCGGVTFLTKNNDFLDLLFIEKNNEIEDLFLCSTFNNKEELNKQNRIYFSFKKDETVNYNPSPTLLLQQQQIEKAKKEFKKFENNITDIETLVIWLENVTELFAQVRYKIWNYSFVEPFVSLYTTVENISELITNYSIAKKAMIEFNNIDISNEKEVVNWLVKYENNELYISYGYKTLENWKKNNLIVFNNSKIGLENIIIDAKKYRQSIEFGKNYSDLYYEYLEKYSPTKELYDIYGSFNGELSEYISVRELFPEILKKYNIKVKEKASITTANKV